MFANLNISAYRNTKLCSGILGSVPNTNFYIEYSSNLHISVLNTAHTWLEDLPNTVPHVFRILFRISSEYLLEHNRNTFLFGKG